MNFAPPLSTASADILATRHPISDLFRTRLILGFYRFLTIAALPLFLLYVLRRLVIGRRYSRGLGERFGFLSASFQRTLRDSIWLHAVSVGEVLSCVELIRRIRENLPYAPVFVSVGTRAGREAAEARLAEMTAGIFYAPFDFVFCVRRVVRRIRPAAVVVLETEIWPALWSEAKHAGCALVVVNGRIGDKAARRYAANSWFFRAVLSLPDAILVQTEQDRGRYAAAGAPPERVSVAGNLKYDFNPQETVPPEPVRQWLEEGDDPLWIAASTVAPEFQGDIDEDDAVIAAWRSLPHTRLLVAPRKPERFDIVAAKWEAAGIAIARRSTLPADRNARVLLLDSLGELNSTFRYARVVFMGGTLARRGGHNILEPALAGKPVVVGDSLENFAAIQRRFRQGNGFFEIRDPGQLADAVRNLVNNGSELGERGRALAEEERGATARAIKAILEARWNAVPRDVPPVALRALTPLWRAGGHIKRKLTRTRRLPVPVVSVGGLAMGGSGKTPVVRMLARSLPGAAVLTRGYRRTNAEPVTILSPGSSAPVSVTGDEAQMILRDGKAQVGIGGDRYSVGSRMAASVFLLDDGFQHAALHRDLDLVVLDGLDLLAGGYVFPAGRLREEISALHRAHAVVISRSEGRRFAGLLRLLPAGMPVFYGTTRLAGWLNQVMGEHMPPAAFREKRVYAFCGIGNPESFRKTLESAGCVIAGFRVFTDHHAYSEADLAEIERASSGDTIVTTEKDGVRLPRPIGFSLLIDIDVPGLVEFVVSRLFAPAPPQA